MKFGKTFPNHQVPEWSHQYVNYKGLKKLIKQITQTQEKLHREQHDHSGETDPPAKPRNTLNINENYLNDSLVKRLLASFFFALDRDIEKVDNFYNMQFLEYDRRLRRLISSAQFADINKIAASTQNISLNSSGAVNQSLYLHEPAPRIDRCNPIYANQLPSFTIQPPQPIVTPTQTDFSEDLDEVLGILVELRSYFRNLKWYGELNKRAFIKILKKLDKKVGTNQQHPYLQARIFPLGFSNDAEIVKDLNAINEILDRISPRVKNIEENMRNDTKVNTSNADLVSNGSDSSFPVDVVSQLIDADDEEGLIKELISVHRSVVLIPTRTLISLLNKSALSQSFKCIDELLEIIPALGDPSDISSRNFFHHHVLALGKNRNKLQNGKQELPDKRPVTEESLNSLLSGSWDLEAAALPDSNTRLIGAFGPDGVNSNDSPASLLYILEKLPAHLRPALLQRDNYKRTPLHYSAQYGLVEVTKIIVESLREWGAWNPDITIDDVKARGDSEGLTPLHLAVIGTHPMTVKVLNSFINPNKALHSSHLLHLATRLNSPELIDALLSVNGFEIDYQDEETRETALYIASKLNLVEATTFLLEKGASTELGEKFFGWTPMFAAATEGYADIVRLLLKYGAKYDIFDESGWTPMEHAALRGHLEIASMVQIKNNPAVTNPKVSPGFIDNGPSKKSTLSDDAGVSSGSGDSSSKSRSSSPNHGFYEHPTLSQSSIEKVSEAPKASHKKLLKSTLNHGRSTGNANSLPQPVKSFGHSFLQNDESIVLITLGSKDTRSTSPAVSLNKVPVSKVSSTELDTALSLIISCTGDMNESPMVIDLPLDDTMDSVTFKVPYKPDSSHTVYFDIVPTYGYSSMKIYDSPTSQPSDSNSLPNFRYDGNFNGSLNPSQLQMHKLHDGQKTSKPRILGRAVALLDKARTQVGANRRSLSDTITIPIMASETLEVLGTVKFEFMIVTPFCHPKMSLGRTETYWKSLVSTRVIGHRGLGKNMNTKKSLQLGENTVESFIAAASLGASYVEFDVQLTKDSIPVVYHDFLVAESGVDIPMHELTLEQFLDLNNADKQHHPCDNGTRRRRSVDDTDAAVLQRSLMMRGDHINNEKGSANSRVPSVLENRMRLTKTFKKNNFKGNFRGHSIASSFVTLKELFKKIPKNVGFNIECKYPMLDEAQEEDIGQIAVELNYWVDTVLRVVYENANGRDIIFSSFHPDVCVMLSLKQPSIPILFLTEAGTQKMADFRASSLQSAIRFARRWNLLGIVSAAMPIVKAPRLAQVVKSSGLVCVTYGVQNNDPETARTEMDAGVDAVIVDSVLAVRKGLTRDAATTITATAAESATQVGKNTFTVDKVIETLVKDDKIEEAGDH